MYKPDKFDNDWLNKNEKANLNLLIGYRDELKAAEAKAAEEEVAKEKAEQESTEKENAAKEKAEKEKKTNEKDDSDDDDWRKLRQTDTRYTQKYCLKIPNMGNTFFVQKYHTIIPFCNIFLLKLDVYYMH